jgi:hypothetical protein
VAMVTMVITVMVAVVIVTQGSVCVLMRLVIKVIKISRRKQFDGFSIEIYMYMHIAFDISYNVSNKSHKYIKYKYI